MKIIQSLWTLPSQAEETEEGRTKGGWLAQEFHYMSLALSCLLLRRHYQEVELITDEWGKELLIDRLKLPYTSVNVCLDRLNHHHRGLWALPKLYSYSIQDRPFLHVDGDVFTWAPFDAYAIRKHSLVAQSPELNHQEIYKISLNHIQKQLEHLPMCIQNEYTNISPLNSVNAGVLGGSDLDFLHYYATIALGFIENNHAVLSRDAKAGLVNIVAEQYLFSELARESAKDIHYIIPKLSSTYKEVLQLNRIPVTTSFVHLVGHAKKEYYSCEQVKYRLHYEFPQQYASIQRALIDMVPSRYYMFPQSSESAYFAVMQNSASPDSVALQKPTDPIMLTGPLDVRVLADELQPLWPELKAIATSLKQTNAHNIVSISSVYDFMSRSTTADLMTAKMTLAECCHIIPYASGLLPNGGTATDQLIDETDEHNFIILQHRDIGIFGQKLDGWSELLVYFQDQVLTGQELLDLLSNNINGDKYEYLHEQVLEFVCSHLVYTGYLALNEFVDRVPTTALTDNAISHSGPESRLMC